MSGVPYVAVSYAGVFGIFLAWTAIMLRRFGRRQRELDNLDER
jgi:hypothetical protein